MGRMKHLWTLLLCGLAFMAACSSGSQRVEDTPSPVVTIATPPTSDAATAAPPTPLAPTASPTAVPSPPPTSTSPPPSLQCASNFERRELREPYQRRSGQPRYTLSEDELNAYLAVMGIESLCIPLELGAPFVNVDWDSKKTPSTTGRMLSLFSALSQSNREQDSLT